jgi:hypothetical protein
MVTSFIGVIKLVTMLYLIPDTLLKVSFNTNKTGHHDIAEILLKVALKHQKSIKINLVQNKGEQTRQYYIIMLQ